MNMKSVSVPEIYKESQDFRFFLEWFSTALRKIQFDTENFLDLYDPLKCPEDLLWALGDTMGYKYDDRLPASFNRLVLLYFMSLIYNRGSKDGVALAAEVNLAQLKILMQANGYKTRDDDGNVTYVKGNPILNNRLEDTTIPVNAVSVIPHTDQGYIDVVYYASVIPIDACIEYVRPLGMFCFQHAGVCFESRTKIKIDARLTDSRDLGMSFGPTHVGHYRREDYARLQKTLSTDVTKNDETHQRHQVWYRNSKYEDNTYGDTTYGSGTWSRDDINPGYRSLYSLQLSNNEETIKALISPIFSLGYEPQSLEVTFDDDYLTNPSEDDDKKPWNLRYDKTTDEEYTPFTIDKDGKKIFHVITDDSDHPLVSKYSTDILNPRPAVNPVMTYVGDAMSMNSGNTLYTKTDEDMANTDTSRNIYVVDPVTGEKYETEDSSGTSDTGDSTTDDTTE